MSIECHVTRKLGAREMKKPGTRTESINPSSLAQNITTIRNQGSDETSLSGEQYQLAFLFTALVQFVKATYCLDFNNSIII